MPRVVRWDGLDAPALAARLGVPLVALHDVVGSTQDAAHRLAEEGAPAGALVLADAQTAGRGRQGRPWTSRPGAGIWATLLARGLDAAAVGVLALRLGLAAAEALDAYAEAPVQLKWPNDLYVAGRKLAGILVEARWRDGMPEWAALGIGVNVATPEGEAGAAGLRPGTGRLAVLEALVPRLRAAAGRRGPLDDAELAAFAARDLARGRRIVAPVAGAVAGLTPDGALLVETASGPVPVRAGSLVLAGELP